MVQEKVLIRKHKLFWIYLLSASIYACQGIEGLPGMSLFFYLKEALHYSPSTIMYISSITGLAWLIKPVWGYLCDVFFTKKFWVLASLFGSMLIAGGFSVLPVLPLMFLISLMFLASWNSAVRDVAVDGVMCVDGKQENSCDRIQAVQWTAITIASIFVGLCGGWLADHATYRLAYAFLIPVYILIVIIAIKYPTTKAPIVENVGLLAGLKSYKSLFTDKRFLIACLFLFLYKFNPSFGTPLMFIQRDIFKWSGTWMGILGAIVSSFEIIGAIIFFKYCKTVSIKRWLTISVFIGAISSLCYLYFTPVTAIVYGILFSVVGMFVHLIVMSFMAQATLPGKEATSFSLLCSVNNLAATASTISGAYLFPKLGLTWLIIVASLTSFICLPLIKKLGIK